MELFACLSSEHHRFDVVFLGLVNLSQITYFENHVLVNIAQQAQSRCRCRTLTICSSNMLVHYHRKSFRAWPLFRWLSRVGDQYKTSIMIRKLYNLCTKKCSSKHFTYMYILNIKFMRVDWWQPMEDLYSCFGFSQWRMNCNDLPDNHCWIFRIWWWLNVKINFNICHSYVYHISTLNITQYPPQQSGLNVLIDQCLNVNFGKEMILCSEPGPLKYLQSTLT